MADVTTQRGKAGRSREAILRIAARLFSERGIADTSLRDIAAEADMQAASLYYHFASKDDLATAVLARGVEVVAAELRRALDALPPDTPPRARLRAGIGAHLRSLLEESEFTSAHIRCFPRAPAAVRDALARERAAYEELWTELLDDDPGGDGRYRRMALLGALNWSLEWWRPGRDDLDAFADTLAELWKR